jgi:hypothetical protein
MIGLSPLMLLYVPRPQNEQSEAPETPKNQRMLKIKKSHRFFKKSVRAPVKKSDFLMEKPIF